MDDFDPCLQCERVFTKTNSLTNDFCSLDCERKYADANGELVIERRGRFPRIGYLYGESFTFPSNPTELIERAERCPIDLFTFLQHPSRTGIQHRYYAEAENWAILPITTFDDWFTKQVHRTARSHVRVAWKRGVTTDELSHPGELLMPIHHINSETPVRQGRPYPHYGISSDETIKRNMTFLSRSIWIAARVEGEIIGFVKMFLDQERTFAFLGSIVAYESYRKYSPMNALLAEAVKACERHRISQLCYAHFQYGNKTKDGLQRFKVDNGFERVDVPRYYVPTTLQGEMALKLGLHRPWRELIPKPIADPLRGLRRAWYAKSS